MSDVTDADGADWPPIDHAYVEALENAEPLPESGSQPLEFFADMLRRHGYQVTAPDPNATIRARRNAPDTSVEAVRRISEGSIEDLLLQLLGSSHISRWTADEIEEFTGRSHGSVSGGLNRLLRKGLIYDTGQRRNTRGGSPAIVWTRTEHDPIYRTGDSA